LKRILVTGGSGFIGTNLIDYYLKENAEILNIDIKPPQKMSHSMLWRNIDIRESDNLRNHFIDFHPDYVIHLAARADLKGKTIEDYSSNTVGVSNIVNVCNEVSTIKKVIFTSTMLVCKSGYVPLNSNDYCPSNLYGESKEIGEKIVKDSSSKLKYEWVIVRPASIWGPWFGPTYRGFFELILKRRYFNFTGKMSCKTYGYIGNIVYQIDEILKAYESHGKTLYLGDYEPTCIREWAHEIGKETDHSICTVPKSFIWLLAKIGDLLSFFKIKFPMNSFRFKNMTTDNILPLNETKKFAPLTLFDRIAGNKETIKWMREFYFKKK